MTGPAVALGRSRLHYLQPWFRTLTLLQQDASMTAKLASAALILFVAAPLAAQARAYIITRLGTDTVAVERYTRSSDKLEGDLVLRNPRVRTIHYIADLGSQGEIKSITASVRRPNTDPTAAPVTRIAMQFADTVAVMSVQRNGTTDTTAVGRKVYHGRVAPTLGVEPTSYGIFEQLLSS